MGVACSQRDLGEVAQGLAQVAGLSPVATKVGFSLGCLYSSVLPMQPSLPFAAM